MKKQKIVITLLTTVTLLLILMPNVDAALQSNGGTPAEGDWDDWIKNIRYMEALNAGMGLQETINSTTLVPTSASNNVDVHMQKNSEYGAMAILSASSYGNPNVIAQGQTTTGNKTGIVINTREWVAMCHPGLATSPSNFGNINRKYLQPGNAYGLGSALIETSGWHGSRYNSDAIDRYCYRGGMPGYDAYPVSIFSAHGANYVDSNAAFTRAAMVCGEGI